MKLGPQKAENYNIYSGFQASFNYYACGLLLKVDNANKLINQKNILQMIDKLYTSMQNQPKEAARQRIRELLIGKVVVSNYGNYSTYKILDIDFKVNAGTATFLDQKTGQQITMKKYFEDKYQMTLTNEQQPLLVSEIEDQKKQKKTVQLVPEFMNLTGLQDDVNESIRRQVLRLCNKKPDEKMKQCTSLVNDLNQSEIQNQCRSIWHIQPQSYTFKGKKLRNPIIKFFNGDLEDNKVSNFQMRNQQFLEKNPQNLKWLMFYQKEGLDLQQFNELFRQNTINYGFPVEPPIQIELDRNNPEDAILHQLKGYLKDQHDFHIVLFVIKQQYKNIYAKIKKECTVVYQIPSQVIVIENLQKNMGSIIGKVVQQITSKTGGYPWGVQANGNIYDVPFILIGATVQKDKIQKKRTVASLVYTVNKKATKFHNQTKYQEDGSDIIIDIKEMIKTCLKDYYNCSQEIPQRIFFFREGINPSGRNSFLINELPFILQAPKEIDSKYSPGIAVCLVDRKPTQKFFVQKDNITKNPQYGTVIDSHVVNDKDEYEFKMIPQLVSDNLGCATPTQYSFVYDTTGITQSQMQNLIYAQCFNYSNWNGPIRVPSVVQYAIKNAEQVATNIHQSVINSRLNRTLWFL